MKWWLSVTFIRPLFVFCTLELITSYLCFKSLLAICFLQIEGYVRWIFFTWHRMECFLWALCVFTEAFLFSIQVIIFVVKNTPSLGSFPLRRLIFSMIILCLSSESMWVSNDGISQIFAVYDSIFTYACIRNQACLVIFPGYFVEW